MPSGTGSTGRLNLLVCARRPSDMDDAVHPSLLGRTRLSETDHRKAFATLLSQARLDRAYRLAAAVLRGSTSDAEDAVHDAALRAWTHWTDIRDPSAFDPWFDRIVVNICRDRLRAHVRPSTLHLAPDGSQRTMNDRSFGALGASYDALSPEHRIVVALRYLDDLSLDEISRRTNTKVGTVKSRLHYALRALRADYDALRRSTTNER